MITVSSSGVKLQEVLSGLEREGLKHWRYTYTFVAFLNIHYYCYFFFLSTWGVIYIFFIFSLFVNVTDIICCALLADVRRQYDVIWHEAQ